MKPANNFSELRPEQLYWRCPPEAIVYDTTASCPACEDIIGQDRALESLKTGLEIKSRGYNIFITGMVGTGRTTTIKQFLEKIRATGEIPDDLLYVNNFSKPDEPVLLSLPAGRGRLLSEGLEKLIAMLRTNIPELLKSQYFQEKKQAILETQQRKQREILQKFDDLVAAEGFTVIQVPVGIFTRPELIPVVDGQPTPFNKLEALVREEKMTRQQLDELKKKYEQLTEQLEKLIVTLKEIDEETQGQLKSLEVEACTPLIKGGLNDLRQKLPFPAVQQYLDEVEKNLALDLDLFKASPKEEPEKETGLDPYLAYRVNLLVDNSETKGAPVVMEISPSYPNLFGTIEYSYSRFGVAQTDFTKIKAGSFLKANGGYLVLNALDVLTEPGVWPTLLRTLRYQTFEIQNPISIFAISTARLKPEPIKCRVKVIMIGDDYLYNLLYFYDEDFKKIFKVKVEFDSEMEKNKKTINDYVRFIKKICDEDGLRPVDREGIAAIVEFGVRLAGRQKKLSTRFHLVADIIREADYWAKHAGKEVISREDVEKAIQEKIERVNLVERKIQEMIEEGTILIDTEGRVVGQVNGLAVYDTGELAFGKPTRITARTSTGRAGVINIEREADLSGRTHNKGVLILSGYLRGKYAQDKPFALSASIAFEQSYSGVDGDSASAAEAFAILSSLSGVPLRQDIAVTGSINQRGEIQPIGGVNEKIEGFFQVCKARGLTGTQGVIIPHQNVKNLMLKEEVVRAVADGKFHIYPIKTVDEGMEILTGVRAGDRLENGTYEEETINSLVDAGIWHLGMAWEEFEDELLWKHIEKESSEAGGEPEEG
ncbi:MAG: ATP-dependent protease La [Candidatus Saccharicenans subterraneus]|uniref:endopeptidase La n=1 Tax=Candidatus Saccharicenans subterraneus TaxID=2508984 RepID=A0A3E2BJY5_9BACT|nr:MAG: ATP-dependent protease La [Candidatus Saccharicenans subterraneum]